MGERASALPVRDQIRYYTGGSRSTYPPLINTPARREAWLAMMAAGKAGDREVAREWQHRLLNLVSKADNIVEARDDWQEFDYDEEDDRWNDFWDIYGY